MNIPILNFDNLYSEDVLADAFWDHLLGRAAFADLRPRFVEMGRRGAVATPLSARADLEGPQLKTHSPQGERIDRVEFHPDYHELEKLAYEGGIVSLKYDAQFLQRHRAVRHVAGFGIGYYFAQTEIGLYCPICMTDALGRVLERQTPSALLKEVIGHLGSDQLTELWQGSMYLTESQGGSDVGTNSVRAEQRGERWLLNGDKWFCSNVSASAILALARMPGPDGDPARGTRGLGLFLVLRPKPAGNDKTIRIHRLKDKLGVRSMPTGEITFESTEAFLIAGADEGFKAMAEMLNMSRLYNAVASLAGMRRALLEAARYGQGRHAFGGNLWQLPLWRAQMADLAAEHFAAALSVFSLAKELDQADGGDHESEQMVRLLTPLTKASSGKLAIFAASEAMELIGGNAYIEESILPRLLRDCQVLPIWEGTTNILSLDGLRVVHKLGPDFFYQKLRRLAGPLAPPDFLRRLDQSESVLRALLKAPVADQQRGIRAWSEEAARVHCLARVLEAGHHPGLAAFAQAAFARLTVRPYPTAPLGTAGAVELASSEEILLRGLCGAAHA